MVIEPILEAINVAKETGISVQLSHLKVSGKQNYGLSKTMLGFIDYYRKLGINVNGDAYPSTYCQTGLENCLPLWTREAGRNKLIEILNEEEKV